MIEEAESAWNRYRSGLDAVWVADNDQYTETVDLRSISASRIHHIQGADHNFSNNDGVSTLIESTLRALASLSQGLPTGAALRTSVSKAQHRHDPT